MDAADLSQPQCPVCIELFNCTTTVPKVLGMCGHSICEACLLRCVRDEEDTCPECRQVSQQPANGFPSNFGLLSKLAAETTANLELGSTTIKCSGCEENVPKAKAFVCATCPPENEAVEVLCAVCGIVAHSGHQLLKHEKLASAADLRRARTEVHFRLREAKEQMDAVELKKAEILDAINGLAQRFAQQCEDLKKKVPAGSLAIKVDLDAAVTGARKLNSDAESTLGLAERFLRHCRTANRDASAASDDAEGPQVAFMARTCAATSTPSTSASGSDESDIGSIVLTDSQLGGSPLVKAGAKKRRLFKSG